MTAFNIREEYSKLAPLQTFEPGAFIGNDEVPQDLCSLVLALALFYNDLKNAIYGYLLLEKFRPEGTPQKRPDWGAYFGIRLHLTRYHLGLLHELRDLVKENEAILENQFFKSCVTQMSKLARKAWVEVVDSALGKSTSSSFEKLLARIRHKVTSHYDPEELFSGYLKHFFEGRTVKERAYISIGQDMSATRFYFADAAVQDFLILRVEKIEEFFYQARSTTNAVNTALMDLVHRFIQKRSPYRKDR